MSSRQDDINLAKLLSKIVIDNTLERSIKILSTLSLVCENVLKNNLDDSKRKLRLKSSRINADICEVKLSQQVLLDSGWKITVIDFQEYFILFPDTTLVPIERLDRMCKLKLMELKSRRDPPTDKEKKDAEHKRVLEDVRIQQLDKLGG
jgi:hypothetical protein